MKPAGYDLTVVIPVYNREGLILRTLESIKNQTVPPHRVIVVDNNSGDNTLFVLNEFAKNDLPFEFIILQEVKPGAAAARNRGLREVRTQYMLFFDSDDVMPPHHIETIIQEFSSPESPEMIVFPREFIYPDGKSYKPQISQGDIITGHLVSACFSTLGVAIKTELARRVGGWNETLSGWDDFEFGLRLGLSAKGIKRTEATNPIIFHQSESLTGNDFISKRGVWEKALDSMEKILGESDRPQKRKWLNWLRYRRVILEAHYAKESSAANISDSGLPGNLLADLPLHHRLALKFCYSWTKRGLRGAYYFYRLINGW